MSGGVLWNFSCVLTIFSCISTICFWILISENEKVRKCKKINISFLESWLIDRRHKREQLSTRNRKEINFYQIRFLQALKGRPRDDKNLSDFLLRSSDDLRFDKINFSWNFQNKLAKNFIQLWNSVNPSQLPVNHRSGLIAYFYQIFAKIRASIK